MSEITSLERGMQRRTELLLGHDNLARIQEAKVLIFGLGGVGSWCAEALVRSGIRHITMVDSDRVCATNCNRQLMATSKTIGQVKIEALKERLLEINPNADIDAQQRIYDATTADSFKMEEYDFVIDAIDSLSEKSHLILKATSLPKNVTFISSMGAALRTDPFLVRKAEFWDVKGDPLARAIRKKFKHNKTFPARKFYCVYSEEQPMENIGENFACGLENCICKKKKLTSKAPSDITAEDQRLAEHDWTASKAQVNGSMCHITAIFGMSIAGIVINKLIGKQ
ncbi:MAG: tRNA threonylcarbamoyladenosine dehydratase [Bacteroidales bacterium]|nr:tRNA threonylcarbamoyladenosine dehydratase [Bacteroidales bacterium]